MITEYSFEELLFSLGLYKEIQIDYSKLNSGQYTDLSYDFNMEREATIYTRSYSDEFQHLINFLIHDKNIFGFCPFCNERLSLKVLPIKLEKELLDSIVHHAHEDSIEDDHYYDDSDSVMNSRIAMLLKTKFLDKWVQCTHDSTHIFKYSFHLNLKTDDLGNSKLAMTKIGQYPSLSDLFTESLKKYKVELDAIGCYKDFSTGCYMYSHGLGIGSYAYMRRVFERLISNAFTSNQEIINCEYDEFKKLKMDQKVLVLKEFLPTFLTENNKNIYKILSLGIHQLEEDECKKMFPVIKNAIEIILEEEILEKEQQRLKLATSKAMDNFSSELVLSLSARVDADTTFE
ncbi:hypothetical protein [Paenibacillus terrae]|uniref:hypothetical protein n=1 Tax=Paenibacillus terrae TaxID=159743 RepID=UPI0011EB5CB5|nr:hypothetical protein [Paenibacillus terrae]